MKIWKFTFYPPRPGKASRFMPRGAKIISGQVQYGIITIWAEVDSTLPLVNRTFDLVETGDVCEGTFIATFLLDDGTYVLHLYEVFGIEGVEA